MSAGPVIVLGAGGHAKVVIELLRASGHEVFGVLDADPTPRTVVDAPVIGDDSRLESLKAEGVTHAFIAIGDNGLRLRLGRKAQRAGLELVNAVSPFARVSPSARLGVGIAIMAGAVINAESDIRDLAIINTGAVIDHDGLICEAAHVAPGCALAGDVTVGQRAFLGVGSSVIPGRHIGEDAVVGAGACVVHDIPASALAMGVPARVTGRV
ncbi:acetyltransferase [Caulobacter segnis]|uniref:acetyltransferase n=1 Tax=Caulobacter segnis TaxID=88688 RepID=UPI0024105A14|nr:acetyltransferase [Caulobacter segnis]MDG2521280.1 acetyltransferase [Caulobacter segnis]